MQLLEGLPDHVKIVEVGPRDGLQNEKELVSLPHAACPPAGEGDLLTGLRPVQDTGLYAAQSSAGRHSSQEPAASQRSSLQSHIASIFSFRVLCLLLAMSAMPGSRSRCYLSSQALHQVSPGWTDTELKSPARHAGAHRGQGSAY